MPRHVVIDVETAQSYDHVIEIAAVEIIANSLTRRRFVRRVKPRSRMNPFCYAVHGISLEDLQNEPHFEQVLPELINFIGGDIIVAHNSAYEYNTLKREFERASRPQTGRRVLSKYDILDAAARFHGVTGETGVTARERADQGGTEGGRRGDQSITGSGFGHPCPTCLSPLN